MSTSSGDRNPVECLAEEFLERHRRGERPALTEYVKRHPEWAEEIREVFPALMMMERLKPAQGDITGSFAGGPRPLPNHVPEQLGDFRILREVGRGGMGIVYEATQESLDRHVALKVLPSHSLLNPKHLLRFRREARAAARLHHTNIVPVFGMGETTGQHYYVMQFIVGSGVHDVVEELKRLKKESQAAAPPKPSPAITRGASLAAITEGFLTGRFPNPDTADDDPAVSPSGTQIPSLADSNPGSLVQTQSSENFAKAVARVGVQVARALEYAHAQGVFHRDIKPANLLLDIQGTAWVADFGLAKTLDDTDNISVDGDMLGTLRYMAPERFKGDADGRSDIYALGLTLYELLTLRPAFDETDQNRLILQVTTATPPRPRSINREIPRDLETIVLKAIEHDPSQRYQSAAEMADDLECFLESRPIGARSVGNLERAWKWAKRKPAVAGLMAALAVSLTLGFIGITSLWVDAVAARDKADLAANEAKENSDRVTAAVNTFYTEVSEAELLDQPGMQPLRRRLLNLALGFYQDFQRQKRDDPRQKGDDPKLMRALADAALRSGMINKELGDPTNAYLLLLKSYDILNQEVSKFPDDVELRLLKVRAVNELTEADSSSDLGLAMIKMYTALTPIGLATMKAIAARDPDNLQYLKLLGRSYHLTSAQGRRLLSSYDHADTGIKGINALERYTKAKPEDVEGARWLALAYSDFALVDHDDSSLISPLFAVGRAVEIFGLLEQRFPKSRRHRLDHAAGLVRAANVELDFGLIAQASLHLDLANSRLAKLHTEDPADADVRYWFAGAQRGLGRVALAHERPVAQPLLRESIAINHRLPEGVSLLIRDLIDDARSHAWMARAQFQAGDERAVAMSIDKLRAIIEFLPSKTQIGYLLPAEKGDIDGVNELVEPVKRADSKMSLPLRIESARRKLIERQARSKKFPTKVGLRYQAAWDAVDLADLLRKNGQFDEARTTLQGSLPTLKELSKSAPNNFLWKQSIAQAREILARIEAKSGHQSEALKAADEGVKIVDELAAADSAYLFELACARSVRFEVAQTPTDAAAALETLGKAIADGFANDHRLQTDDRLESLRTRPEFPKMPTDGVRSPRG